jgi:hypothetical protein
MDMPVEEPGQQVRAVAETVVEQPSSSDVSVQVDEAITAIAREADSLTDPAQAALFRATVTLMAAAKATMQSIGECQIVEPYADVYVVMTPEGQRYCCTHNPQHCQP